MRIIRYRKIQCRLSLTLLLKYNSSRSILIIHNIFSLLPFVDGTCGHTNSMQFFFRISMGILFNWIFLFFQQLRFNVRSISRIVQGYRYPTRIRTVWLAMAAAVVAARAALALPTAITVTDWNWFFSGVIFISKYFKSNFALFIYVK